MPKSFLSKWTPCRVREKPIEWPFPAADGEEQPPRVTMRVLGAHELEAAHLAALDHFRSLKHKGDPVQNAYGAFRAREKVEQVWRAFRDPDGNPLEETAEELHQAPVEITNALHDEWSRFQEEATLRPLTEKQVQELIEELKKNTPADLLDALPSIWLRQLLPGLVGRPGTSTTQSAAG